MASVHLALPPGNAVGGTRGRERAAAGAARQAASRAAAAPVRVRPPAACTPAQPRRSMAIYNLQQDRGFAVDLYVPWTVSSASGTPAAVCDALLAIVGTSPSIFCLLPTNPCPLVF